MKPNHIYPRQEKDVSQSNNRINVPAFLYVQIAESLLNWIESEELTPGKRLPPERELSKTLGVNRTTIRQALNILQDRGLIYRRQGQGTFVASPKIERQAGKLVPFTKSMQQKGYKIEARLITLEKILTDVSLAEELQLTVGQPAYFLCRIRLINREPVLLENIYIPAILFPEVERFDLSQRSLYEVMDEEYNVKISYARQSLEPVTARKYEADLLGIEPGAPLMLERRLAFDQHERAVERALDLFRGDRFRFVTELAPLEL